MDYDIVNELHPHLNPGEKLIWTGRPKQGLRFRSIDIFLIPFTFMWCGFAFFWLTMVLTSGAPVFIVIFGIPFVLIGLLMSIGRFFIDARFRARTFYGITEERIIIKSGFSGRSVESIMIRTLSEITYKEKSDGSGIIVMGQRNPAIFLGSSMNWWPGIKIAPTFDLIPDVRTVYNKLILLQKA